MADEGFVQVPGGRVFWRSVGDGDVPLLCLHGGPGFPHDYMEALEGLADRRRVVFYDQLGCGSSDRPDDESLWTVERFVEELVTVRDALELDRLHLFGSSWGGMLAMQYAIDRKPKLESLTLCSSPASIPRWVDGCNELLAALPQDVQDEIKRHEDNGYLGCPEYAEAVMVFYRRHLCRLKPWPDGLERSYRDAGLDVYNYMNGPTEFTVVGTLKEWSVMERLGKIETPTLVVSGEHDEFRPEHAKEVADAIPGSQQLVLDGCSHLAFAEEPDRFLAVMNEFLDRVEARAAA
ncbi:MAG: proline iminopeptidase-family hydrolase [Actinomycetota bacterium]|nr:proline iminopeptidase-family hydrolase [Actinomycetota bacterium]